MRQVRWDNNDMKLQHARLSLRASGPDAICRDALSFMSGNRIAVFCLSAALMASAAIVSVPAFALDPASTEKETSAILSPMEALRSGARKYYSGDKEGALQSLQYAAENGQPMAAWKLGEMYAHGDGVPANDKKAFEYFTQIVREHGDDRPDAPDAPFVSSAFVALGSYYLSGIKDVVPKNPTRARQIFTHAASYFGDADAQFQLGQMYQGSSDRLAVRWYNLAAIKGHVGAQARLGETLFNLGQSESKQARGLMWITVARDQVVDGEADWVLDLHERYFALASEPVRSLSRRMADTWIERNRPELMTAQTVAADQN